MESLTKDIIAISISAISLFIAIYALFSSRKTAKKTSKIEASNILAEIHEKINEGRRVMQDIYRHWEKKVNSSISTSELLLSQNVMERNDLINFYNSNYHTMQSGTPERNKSNQIHCYLHEIHHLWVRHEDKEFTLEEIFKRFYVAISMDKDLLKIFIEAHWQEHGELEKNIDNRFWNNVPKFIEASEKWEEQ